MMPSRPGFQFGMSSYAWHWHIQYAPKSRKALQVAFDLLKKAKSCGMSVVQICDDFPLQKMTDADWHQVKTRADAMGITLELGCRGLKVGDLRQHIRMCKLINAGILRVVPSHGSKAAEKQDPVERLVKSVRAVLPQLKAAKVTLAVENHFHVTDEQLVKAMRIIKSKYVGICLDTANSCGLQKRSLETVKMLAPYTVSVHLKDYEIHTPFMGYRIDGVPLGQGLAQIPEAMKIIKRIKSRPNILLETWLKPCDSRGATLRTEESMLRKSVTYARNMP